ncbi:PAS domain-containing sensor histidine kinase [Enterovirga rhinocerotis]|uniref:PAS domain-containing sensor histidine kinase n=1 Tax=Enterovirga rhinocerotis TaxID=1339210 RepID=UPI00105BF6B3|nr:ATP-binding protein [Enterovirga rhinocerotis]
MEALPRATLERLRLLAGGLAPRAGFRLERLRLAGLAPPVTFACRILSEAGEDVLLTVILDSPAASRSLSEARAASDGDRPQYRDESPRPPAEVVRPRGRRFTWSADADGRFTTISPEFHECVGEGASAALGDRWEDLVGRLVIDQDGGIGRALSGTTAWHRLPAQWLAPASGRVIPVELSGTPLAGEGGGWRGFGLAWPDEAQPAPAGALAAAAVATEPGPAASPVDPSTGDSADDTVFGMLRSWFSAQLGESLSARIAGTEADAERTAGPSGDQASAPIADADRVADTGASAKADSLSLSEQGALHEIARALSGSAEGEPPSEERDSAEIVPLPVQHVRSGEPTRLLDDMPVGIVVLRDGVPLFANRFLLANLSARDLPDLVATDGLHDVLGLDPDGGERTTTLALGAASGERRIFEARAGRIGWGDLGAVLVVLTPPVEGASAELGAAKLELHRRDTAQREFATSLDLAADGVVTLDAAARLLSLSGSAERLFGVRANEVVGDSVTALVDPRDHRALLTILDSLRGGASDARAECELLGRTRDGTTIPLSVRAGRSPVGHGSGFALAFRDIRHFKLLEQDLREARAVAETASANRADFLARISHEVRTPLTAITGFAELMLEERFGPLGNERYKEYLKDVRDSGVHVLSLINDLLDLAKATSGRTDLQPSAVDLNALAQQCVGLTAPLAARERTILRTSFSPDISLVYSDERSVRQIVINVLSNAIRFAGAGGQVIVSTAVGGHGEVVLSVRDTGPGMSKEEIAAALTPFRQVPSTRRSDGTGLGLPLSKALAEANDGALSVTSAPDLGTLVEVRLPAYRPAIGAVAAE